MDEGEFTVESDRVEVTRLGEMAVESKVQSLSARDGAGQLRRAG